RWHFSALTNNCGGLAINNDGAIPLPCLILSDGVLYGATESGGAAGDGTLFSLNIAPQIQINDGSFSIRTNGLGFNVAGYSNQIVVVEACTDLATSSWSPLETNTIETGPIDFLDFNWTNYPRPFYRIRTH